MPSKQVTYKQNVLHSVFTPRPDVSGAFDTFSMSKSGSLPTRGTVSSSDLIPSHLCNEACQQGITGYVEGHAQTQVTAPLVHLTRQLPICHIELQHRHACDDHAEQCSKEKQERKGKDTSSLKSQ